MRKRKFMLWLSIWLSLGSVLSACGTTEEDSTTLETAAIVTPRVDPTEQVSERIKSEQEAWDSFLIAEEARKQEAAKAAKESQERRAKERAARQAQRPVQTITGPPPTISAPPQDGRPCGGNLPPCWVLNKENKGADPRLWNGGCYAPVGWMQKSPCGTSSASGIYQIVRSTWGTKQVNGVWKPGYGGYWNAADAPAEVQLAHARALWNNGKGCSHWRAC